MYKKLTAGLALGGLITAGLAAGPSAAADQPVEIHGSFQTADGLPYYNVRWIARAVDGTISGSGVTDAAGSFSLLASPASDTEIVFSGLSAGRDPAPWESPAPTWDSAISDSMFCAEPDWADDVNLKPVPVTIPRGQTRLDLRSQPAHRATVLVTDKYGELVRNATIDPNSSTDQFFSNQWDKDWFSHNYRACSAPNQWFAGVSGLDSTLRLGGWVPGLTGGTTDSAGKAVIATPGAIDPNADFAVVRAAIRPGATQMTRVSASSLEGNDPLNQVAVAVLPYAPIMEDAATAGAVPGEESGLMRTRSTTAAPTVIVRQPNGQALSNAEVQVVPVLTGDTPAAPREGSVVATATTGGDGRATFTGLPSGKFRAIPVNVSARTVDFTVNGAGDPQPPATQPPVTQPPVTSRPAATVKVKAVSKKSKLKVDVNPNKGKGYWKFQVQKQRSNGSWKALKTYKTKGSKETRTINLKKGTYRVVVKAKYGYQGTTSAPVYLKK